MPPPPLPALTLPAFAAASRFAAAAAVAAIDIDVLRHVIDAPLRALPLAILFATLIGAELLSPPA